MKEGLTKLLMQSYDEGVKDALDSVKEALAQEQEPWCMKMNGCTSKCEDCPVEVTQEERNFCPRCGKRTADLTVIHTCTPPQENT